MMEQNLSDVMHGFMDAERRAAEAAAPDTTAETHALARRIGRRRAVRGAGVGIASVLVLGAVAVGVHALERPEPPLPANPSPSPSVIVTPTAEPTPTGTPEAPEVAPTAYLTDAVPMPAGTFARTDETWLILEYVGLDESSTEIVPRQTYLLAPDGTVYVVPLPDDLADGRVLDWYPGSGLVVLGSNLDRYVVDLATGRRATVPADPTVQFLPGGGGDLLEYGYEGSDLTFRRLDQQGQPVRTLASITDADLGQVFVGPGGDALLVEDPLDGPLALSLVDGTAIDLDLPYPDRPLACRPWTWADARTAVVECAPGGTEDVFYAQAVSEFWTLPLDGGAPTLIVGFTDPLTAGAVWRIDGQTVVGDYGHWAADSSWFRSAADGLVPLSTGSASWVETIGTRGEEFLFSEFPDGADPTIVAVDSRTGERRTLLVVPDAPVKGLTVFPVGPHTAHTFQGE
jgi:hypothetical protein